LGDRVADPPQDRTGPIHSPAHVQRRVTRSPRRHRAWTHGPELRRQLDDTERLVASRQEALSAKYGAPMGDDNVWLRGRREEIGSLNRILLSITDITDRAVRGAGVTDQPA
jgi:hypothetical protein